MNTPVATASALPPSIPSCDQGPGALTGIAAFPRSAASPDATDRKAVSPPAKSFAAGG